MLRVDYILKVKSRIGNKMDPVLLIERLGDQLRSMRQQRGMTLIELAERAGITRQKLAEMEKGKPTVSMFFYAKVIAAMTSEVKIVPARKPTFEELREVFQ